MIEYITSSTLIRSILNSPLLEEASFIRLPFTLWKNTVLISSITFLNAFCFVLALFLWATNRQTQIRPSKSQSRPTVPERKGKKISGSGSKEGESTGKYDTIENSKIDSDFLFSNDWGRQKSRENLLKSFSVDFDIDEEEDEEDDDDDRSETEPNETDDYGNHTDISFGDETAVPPKLNPQMQTMTQDIKQFITTQNIFSYLSDEALKEILKYMKYIDLPDEGSAVLCNPKDSNEVNRENLDGSIYIVIDGSVDCSCQLDVDLIRKVDESNESYSSYPNSKLHFTAGPGDSIKSQLAMVSDLVGLFHNEDASNANCIHPVVVKAITAAPNTRILCIPSIGYLKILEKFPNEVHQLTQTILGRTQRVTMQTLVKSFGLTDEIIAQKYGSWKDTELDGDDWRDELDICKQKLKLLKERENSTNVDKPIREVDQSEDLLQIAAALAAKQLGTNRIEDVELICEHSSILAVNAGSTIIQTGKKSDYLYLLIEGEVEIGNFIHRISDRGLERTMTRPLGISIKDFNLNVKELEKKNTVSFQTSHVVAAGAVVGQLAAYTGEVSMVTIRVSPKNEGPATMLQIPRGIFMELVTANNATLIQSLRTVLQNDFSPVVHLLDWGLRWRDLNTGSVLAQKGQPCKSTYVVLNGRLRSGSKKEKSDPDIKQEHGRGSCIGEVQVLTGDIWPNDVFAIRDSELAEVPLGVLDFIMNMFPTCGVHFARVIANQVQQRYMKKDRSSFRQSDSGLPSYKLSVATIAVVPICFGSNQHETSRFCDNLINCLNNIAPCATMNKSTVRKKLGKLSLKNFVYSLKLSRMLGDLEENNRLVVYQAESHFNWWTKTCIEHSDCVLLVVDSDQTPESSHLMKFLAQTQSSYLKKRVEIVVLTRQEKDGKRSRSLGLNKWIEKLRFETGNNLIRVSGTKLITTDANDMNRMCRRITGCSLGLALGGGGARGIAHLGVIKALLEAGVLVDIVGGTSQGSFVGALFAQNPDDFDLLIERVKLMADKMASMKDKVLDLTLPLVSYFDGKRFNEVIQETIGKETRIEDLMLNFFCVSTDLSHYSQKVHRRGLCWKYVRASMSLHGYLPPISEDGCLLLDGGYTCIVPNDVMSKEIGARAVIAVDVSREEMPNYYEYGSNLSGFWLLWNSWNPFVKTVRVPSMGELSSRLIWVNSSRQQQKIEENCDLFLSPEVHEYGTLDYHLFDEIFELGYTYTKPRIEAFLKDPENQWVLRRESHN